MNLIIIISGANTRPTATTCAYGSVQFSSVSVHSSYAYVIIAIVFNLLIYTDTGTGTGMNERTNTHTYTHTHLQTPSASNNSKFVQSLYQHKSWPLILILNRNFRTKRKTNRDFNRFNILGYLFEWVLNSVLM